LANEVRSGQLREQLQASATELAAVSAANAELQSGGWWAAERLNLQSVARDAEARVASLTQQMQEVEEDRDLAGEFARCINVGGHCRGH